MKIEQYQFGEIVINSKTYTSDVIIYLDRIESDWWRKEGHKLQVVDMVDVLEFHPEVIIIGTGASDMMSVDSEVKESARVKSIELIILPTNVAVKKFNERLHQKKKPVGCFHLTC